MSIEDKGAAKPIVTVVVPVYNVEADLNRCIESLVGQTLKSLQIVLVDDGSTDRSGLLCDSWAKRDKRILVVHKQNGGLSSARNAGIAAADGDYLGFVDSDDYVEPHMFEALLAGFNDDSVTITCCGRYVHMGSLVKEDFTIHGKRTMNAADAMREVLLGNIVDVSACDKLYRRRLFDGVRYPDGRISEDAAIILQLLNRCENVVHVGECLYHYVFRVGSISKACYSHQKYDVMRNCTEMRNWVEANHPEILTYLNSYCCVQMAGLIEDMINTPCARKKWKVDYVEYWNLFRRCYKDYVSIGGHQKKELARVAATRAHLYRFFWIIRQARNGAKRSDWQR